MQVKTKMMGFSPKLADYRGGNNYSIIQDDLTKAVFVKEYVVEPAAQHYKASGSKLHF